jgi:hypothetical protein
MKFEMYPRSENPVTGKITNSTLTNEHLKIAIHARPEDKQSIVSNLTWDLIEINSRAIKVKLIFSNVLSMSSLLGYDDWILVEFLPDA